MTFFETYHCFIHDWSFLIYPKFVCLQTVEQSAPTEVETGKTVVKFLSRQGGTGKKVNVQARNVVLPSAVAQVDRRKELQQKEEEERKELKAFVLEYHAERQQEDLTSQAQHLMRNAFQHKKRENTLSAASSGGGNNSGYTRHRVAGGYNLGYRGLSDSKKGGKSKGKGQEAKFKRGDF